jgi:type IV secretory pathway VirB9-like protein
MIIEVRWVGDYADLTVCTDNATLQLGLQSTAERIELAEHLRYVADKLSLLENNND